MGEVGVSFDEGEWRPRAVLVLFFFFVHVSTTPLRRITTRVDSATTHRIDRTDDPRRRPRPHPTRNSNIARRPSSTPASRPLDNESARPCRRRTDRTAFVPRSDRFVPLDSIVSTASTPSLVPFSSSSPQHPPPRRRERDSFLWSRGACDDVVRFDIVWNRSSPRPNISPISFAN